MNEHYYEGYDAAVKDTVQWLKRNLSRVITCYVPDPNARIPGDSKIEEILKEDLLEKYEREIHG